MNRKKQILLTLWKEWIYPLILVVTIFTPLRSSIADWYQVPTGSMKPTIVEGDRVFVNKLAYDLKIPFTTKHLLEWSHPSRGDIVILYSPEDGMRLVKRVIGLPGDIVEMLDNKLVINGQSLAYEPISESSYTEAGLNNLHVIQRSEYLTESSHPVLTVPEISASRSFSPVRVPRGSYFVMGDNRDRSKDSRYFGFVPREQIIGQAKAVVFSLDPNCWYLPRNNRFLVALK